MKRLLLFLFLIFLLPFSINSCSSSMEEIPSDFQPFILTHGSWSDLIDYSLWVYPPHSLRYGDEILLPAKKDSDFMLVFKTQLREALGDIGAKTPVPDLKITVKIEGTDRWYSYTFYPCYGDEDYSYVTQIILPVQKSRYNMQLIVEGESSKVGLSLLKLFRKTPISGASFKKNFALDRNQFVEASP